MIPALALIGLLAAAPTSRFVIVVGFNAAIEPGGANLRYADDDAARFYELVAPGSEASFLFTSFDGESRELFGGLAGLARPPTLEALTRAVEDVAARIDRTHAAGKRAELYFFYAGHGEVEDGEGFVNLAGGRLTRTEFRRLVLDVPRADRTHVFVDACKSYFLVSGRGPGGARTPYLQPFAAPDVSPAVGFVLSSSSDAESHEWSALAGGVFSHELRSALLGGADADGDGAVSYEELSAFIAVANEGVPSPRFRPSSFVRAPEPGEAVFSPADVPAATVLEIAEGDAGRVSVVDERGLRYADVNKAAGARLRLQLLGPRRYEVRWRGEVRVLEATGRGERVALSGLPAEPEPVAARAVAHRAFGHLFEAPFGPAVVRGFRLGRVQAESLEHTIEDGPPGHPLATGLLVGGGVALAGGALLSVLAVEGYADASGASQLDRPPIADRARGLATGAEAAYLTGVTALAAGLVLLLLESP